MASFSSVEKAVQSKDGVPVTMTVSRLSISAGTEYRGIRSTSNTKFYEITIDTDVEVNPVLFDRALKLTGFTASAGGATLSTNKRIQFSIAVDPDLNPQFRFKDEGDILSVFERVISKSYFGARPEYHSEYVRAAAFETYSKDRCRMSCRLNEQGLGKVSLYSLSIFATGYATGSVDLPPLAEAMKNEIEQNFSNADVLVSIKSGSKEIELSFIGSKNSIDKVKTKIVDLVKKHDAYRQGMLARISRDHDRHQWFHEKQTPELTYDEFDVLYLVGDILDKGLPLPTKEDDPLMVSLVEKGYLAKSLLGKYSMTAKGEEVLREQRKIRTT